LTTVVKKNHDGPGTAVAGTTYPELVALVDRMQAEDDRIVFDSLRPMGDEFWNMIDGEKTVGDIADAVCLEFGFELRPELFLPLVDRMVQREAVSVVAGRSPVPSGREDRS
jgi:hypothetical protein